MFLPFVYFNCSTVRVMMVGWLLELVIPTKHGLREKVARFISSAIALGQYAELQTRNLDSLDAIQYFPLEYPSCHNFNCARSLPYSVALPPLSTILPSQNHNLLTLRSSDECPYGGRRLWSPLQDS